ncbi:protein cul-1 [Stylonychia lemnae]|uniref:Protein cul-1 n=1 Tax=Stylonychia lemnae TaxID=5949 RepID=A0A077ZUB6_STYLE|nr:protein cul-1 [Stylonychia lemnae]|eukprot:CDW73498.1 protein cul-1 [Stylonychia lemnae]
MSSFKIVQRSTYEIGIVETTSTLLSQQVIPQRLDLPADQYKDFQKLIYQSFQTLLACDITKKEEHSSIVDSMKQYLKFSNMKQEFVKVMNMCTLDNWKSLKTKVYKQSADDGRDDDEHTIMYAVGLQKLIENTQFIEKNVLCSNGIMRDLFLHIESNELQSFEKFLKDFIDLLLRFAFDDLYNFEQLIQQFSLLIVSLFDLTSANLRKTVQSLWLQQFSEIQDKVCDIYEILRQQLNDKSMYMRQFIRVLFQAKVANIEFKVLDAKLLELLEQMNSQGIIDLLKRYTIDESLIQRYFSIFVEQYKIYVKKLSSVENSVVLGKLLELQDKFMRDLDQSQLAPMFLSFLIQTNHSILRGYNQASEISQFFESNLDRLNEEMVLQALCYSVDKDKLEFELRKSLIQRVIEGQASTSQQQFNVKNEKLLCQLLQQSFGKNFIHKLNLIIHEQEEDKSDIKHSLANQLQVISFPTAMWINEVQNPLKQQIMHPQLLNLTVQFQESYKAKFKNRNLQFLTAIGKVELILDKKYEILVNTTQASMLLHFNERKQHEISSLRDKQLQIDDDIFKAFLMPLLNNKTLEITQDNIQLSSDLSQLGKQNNCYISSKDIVKFYRNKHLRGTSANDDVSGNSNEAKKVVKYLYKEHKFKIQAYIMRVLKSSFKINKKELFQKIYQKYLEDGIEVVQESIDKCMEEIYEKEYAKEEGDNYLYLP